jgi:hypothetical protein
VLQSLDCSLWLSDLRSLGSVGEELKGLVACSLVLDVSLWVARILEIEKKGGVAVVISV